VYGGSLQGGGSGVERGGLLIHGIAVEITGSKTAGRTSVADYSRRRRPARERVILVNPVIKKEHSATCGCNWQERRDRS
jgi:hypothetical protein